MAAVQQKVTALRFPKDAVKTVGIDLQPEFDYANGRQTLRGYVARNTVECASTTSPRLATCSTRVGIRRAT